MKSWYWGICFYFELGPFFTDEQGRRQGKSLGGQGNLGGPGAVPPVGVQGAEPLGGGQGAKPPEAEAFLVLKSW